MHFSEVRTKESRATVPIRSAGPDRPDQLPGWLDAQQEEIRQDTEQGGVEGRAGAKLPEEEGRGQKGGDHEDCLEGERRMGRGGGGEEERKTRVGGITL